MTTLGQKTPNRVLLREYLNDNHESFRLLLERHQPTIMHYARGYFDSDEEAIDTARRALRRSFRQLPRLRRNSLLSSFLIGVLRSELKRLGRTEAPASTPPLWAALAGLPRVQREVVFFYFQGHPLAEISRIRGEAPSQTRSRFSKALCHVGKRATQSDRRPHRSELPPGCVGQDEIYLYVAEALAETRNRQIAEHAAECGACGEKHRRARDLFELLERDIGRFVGHDPLLDQAPGPAALTTVLAAAGIVLVTLAAFLLIRWAVADSVTAGP